MKPRRNEYGLTAAEWLRAAGVPAWSWENQTRHAKELRDAWLRGEDPTDWRAEGEPKATETECMNLEGCTDSELKKLATDPAAHSSYAEIADWIVTARAYRMRGDIAAALRCERKVDYLYQQLPTNLKW